MDQIRVVGVDVGKTSFHVVDVDGYGVLQLKMRCSGTQLLALMAKLTDCLVAIEACCGAHDLAWEIAPLARSCAQPTMMRVREVPQTGRIHLGRLRRQDLKMPSKLGRTIHFLSPDP